MKKVLVSSNIKLKGNLQFFYWGSDYMGSIQGAVIRFLLRKSNMWNKPLTEVRKSMESIKSKGIPSGVSLKKVEVDGVPCEMFLCEESKKDKVILYFHGGGFCLGIYPANREFVAGLAKESGVNLYVPDYSLAPEHPFPAALEDSVAVYKGMLRNGYNAEDIIVMGDSSGCALALSTLQVVRQSGEKMPGALVFITPVLDFAGKGETFRTNLGKDPFKYKDPLSIAKIYLEENDPTSPMISPLYGELGGLPPVLVHAGEYDVFLSDSCRFFESYKAAGGEAELKVWKKMWHIFHMQASLVPESRKAIDEICSFISAKVRS